MSNPHDLRLAILQLAREDTGAGSLTTLTGQTRPVVRWGDPAQTERPVIAVTFPTGTRISGVPDGYRVTAQFDALVAPQDDGLQHTLLDRLRDSVLTTTQLKTKGIDASVEETSRTDADDLTTEGFRALAEYRFRLTI